MENHPIPQDITGFQFKLIGDLTVKQFAYLAVGVILGWVFFALPINPIIKIPIAIIFVLLGVGLAFLPIQGRPTDIMLLNFIKAFFRPTQFVYKEQKKENEVLNINVSKSKASPQQEKPTEERFFESIPINVNVPPQATQEPSTTPVPNPQPPPTSTPDLSRVEELENKLREALKDKEDLAKKLQDLQQKSIAPTPQPVIAPNQSPQSSQLATPTLAKPISPPMPEFPNLIVGAAHDPRGNPLPNMLVEIKDKDGNPVRAFKTNQLGQFASATPLTNGNYKIEIEDPKSQNRFDVVEFTAKNEVIPPIKITSIDTREELRRSLFGSTK